jgi:predicted RNase H-like HicB family nuclease
MSVKYPYTVEQHEDDKLFIQFVDFFTGFAEADTEAQVAIHAREVLEGLIEEYEENGIKLPIASPVGDNLYVEV